jgi:hypothetical protein
MYYPLQMVCSLVCLCSITQSKGGAPENDGLKELDCRGRLLIGDRDSFDPFGELVDGDQQVSVASSR